jgi:hypothetical protein
MRLRQRALVLSQSHWMVHWIQTNRCGLFSMHRIHFRMSNPLRFHQMVRAWTMKNQSFHRMSGRFHHQMACVWTMTNQNFHRMSELLHQMVCVWTMS